MKIILTKNNKRFNSKSLIKFDVILFLSMFCALGLYNLEVLLVFLRLRTNISEYINKIRLFFYCVLLIKILLNKKINIKFIIYNTFYILILGVHLVIFPENYIYIKEIFVTYCFSILPIMLTIIYSDDAENYLDHLYVISYVMMARVIVEAMVRLTIGNIEYINIGSSMSSGMAMTYQTIIGWSCITYYAFRYRRIIDFIISIIVAMLYMIFGTRGAISIIVAIVIYMMVCMDDRMKKKKTITILVLFGIVILLFGGTIINAFFDIVSKKGVSSYNMSKIMRYGFRSNSRMKLWNSIVNLIKENWFIGAGIGADRCYFNDSASYSHNIFLEMWLDFGMIVGTIILIIIIRMLTIGCFSSKIGKTKRSLLSIFGITGFMMLLFSGSIYNTYLIFAALSVLLIEDREINNGNVCNYQKFLD